MVCSLWLITFAVYQDHLLPNLCPPGPALSIGLQTHEHSSVELAGA